MRMVRIVTLFAAMLVSSSALAADSSFYDQFQFKVSGSCTEPAGMSFNIVTLDDYVLLGQDDAGRNLYATVDMDLFADGTYWAEYRELVDRDTVIEPFGPGYQVFF